MNNFKYDFNLEKKVEPNFPNLNYLNKYQNTRNDLFTPKTKIQNILIDKKNYNQNNPKNVNSYFGKFNINNVIGISFKNIIFKIKPIPIEGMIEEVAEEVVDGEVEINNKYNLNYFDIILPNFSNSNMINNIDEFNIISRCFVNPSNILQNFEVDYIENKNLFTPMDIDLNNFAIEIRLNGENDKIIKLNNNSTIFKDNENFLKINDKGNHLNELHIFSMQFELTLLNNIKSLND